MNGVAMFPSKNYPIFITHPADILPQPTTRFSVPTFLIFSVGTTWFRSVPDASSSCSKPGKRWTSLIFRKCSLTRWRSVRALLGAIWARYRLWSRTCRSSLRQCASGMGNWMLVVQWHRSSSRPAARPPAWCSNIGWVIWVHGSRQRSLAWSVAGARLGVVHPFA